MSRRNEIDISIPIKNGCGLAKTSKTTLKATVTGYFEIISPDTGTWSILARMNGKTILDIKNVKKGQKLEFSHKTGLKTKLEVEAIWSENKDTTLKVHAKVTT
ncbi:hypothetical protein ACSAZK_00585 [Methanosarcina sp. Mfa9]|uniref:hypothetical protein n=1 Tax=Methanosarcina sp. Mfa9 TaxID=3439063 RepID=UPI003F83F548